MNSELLKKLKQLLTEFPELRNHQVAFNNSDADFYNLSNTVSDCNILEDDIKVLEGPSRKVEIRRSNIHGYGVFAKEQIEIGEIIEESKLIPLNLRTNYNNDSVLRNYVWANKSCNCSECKNHGHRQYIASGFGSLYNHSDTPNTKQDVNFKKQIITVIARYLINKDEEIFLNYGKDYWFLKKFWGSIPEEVLKKFLEKENVL